MLKLLLVGFTEQNANVIQMFVELTFDNIKVSRIPRQPDSVANRMPELTVIEAESDIFVFDAQSIGLDVPNMQQAYAQLRDVIEQKPTLLISHQTLDNPVMRDWAGNIDYLTVPYTRQEMAEKLHILNQKAQLHLEKPHPKNTQFISANTAKTLTKTDIASDNPTSQAEDTPAHNISTPSPSKNSNSKTDIVSRLDKASFNVMLEVLASNFTALADTPFFEFAKHVQNLTHPTCLTIGGQHLYINPNDKSVIASRVERIIDYFTVGQNLSQSLRNFQTLDEASFLQSTAQYLAQGHKKISISQLIWLVGLEMIPRNAYNNTHSIKLEVSYMPNFADVKFVPNYVMPMIASCLGRARALNDFNTLFPNLTNAQINQVIILLVLSGAVKDSMITLSRSPIPSQSPAQPMALAENKPTQDNTVSVNDGVKKAQKTGFFQRFLSRLGVKMS